MGRGSKREVMELCISVEILNYECFFALAERPPARAPDDLIHWYRNAHGVEPICEVLQIFPAGHRSQNHKSLSRRHGALVMCSYRP